MRYWTREEDAILIRYYATHGIEYCVKLLTGRSWNAVKTRAGYLGLRRTRLRDALVRPEAHKEVPGPGVQEFKQPEFKHGLQVGQRVMVAQPAYVGEKTVKFFGTVAGIYKNFAVVDTGHYRISVSFADILSGMAKVKILREAS